jgi:hypothetical protein
MKVLHCFQILLIWRHFSGLFRVEGAAFLRTESLHRNNPKPAVSPRSFVSQNDCKPRSLIKRHAVPDIDFKGSPADSERSLFENDGKDDLGDIQIPSTGVSVQDEIESSDRDRFESELVPITGYKKVAAQIVTTATTRGSFEPVRYLISLSNNTEDTDGNRKAQKESTFVLMDIPPFSASLVAKIKAFMGENSQLAAILVTSRDAIHYDDAPAVYRMRRTDLEYWKKAFPGLQIIAYRLDIPRDCRESVTQVLDGYGPFALDESALSWKGNENATLLVETGRPLTYKEWDHDVAQDILRGRKSLDDGNDDTAEDDEYSPEAVRVKEQGKRLLAVFTPGHSFGSVSYIFPETGLCCSGFTIPVENTRDEENRGMDSAGPALDCRGYITTSRGGIAKQMESARHLVNTYCDRFNVILPSRGDPLMLYGEYDEKREELMEIIDQYDKIGKIYETLGITSTAED